MRDAGARRLREDEYRYTEAATPPRPNLRLVEGAQAERRTVVITGQPVRPRRRTPAAARQIEARPDRVALWAFLLCLFLVFMAVATASA